MKPIVTIQDCYDIVRLLPSAVTQFDRLKPSVEFLPSLIMLLVLKVDLYLVAISCCLSS